MQLKINAFQKPETITFNYEELKSELLEKAKVYESLVFTESQVREAKKYRADLNALKKALNDERIRQEKEWMVPFNQFKLQIAEIISIIDKPAKAIDDQIKSFEEKQKEEKKEAILQVINELGFPVPPEMFWNPKWLNATASMESINKELVEKKATITKELEVLSDLDEYSFECINHYKKTLDFAGAMTKHRLLKEEAVQKAKWEEDLKKIAAAPAEPVTAPVAEEPEATKEAPVERQWIAFQAYMSMAEAKEVGAFLRSKGIKYKAV